MVSNLSLKIGGALQENILIVILKTLKFSIMTKKFWADWQKRAGETKTI